MDNLLEALKTGSAFNVGREKRDGKRRTPRAAGGKVLFSCHDSCRNSSMKTSSKATTLLRSLVGLLGTGSQLTHCMLVYKLAT